MSDLSRRGLIAAAGAIYASAIVGVTRLSARPSRRWKARLGSSFDD
jgi:hypothetical protein